MVESLRETGIELIGKVPWSTHFCQFYQTKEDLLDMLVPYFKAGIENNEFCVWVASEPLNEQEAKEALEKAVPDLARYLAKGQIEILAYTDWYLKGGRFESDKVLAGWVDKLGKALAKGFSGLRFTGNTFWLEKDGWKDFTDYEAAVNSVIGNYKMLALCTYSLDRCDAAEIIDVVRNHRFALIKRQNQWELIESSEYKKAKEELVRLASFPEMDPNPVMEFDLDGRVLYANPTAQRVLPGILKEGARHPWLSGLDKIIAKFKAGIKTSAFREVKAGESWYQAAIYYFPEKHCVRIYGLDITERKHMEQELLESREDLNRAQAVAKTGSWRLNVQRNELLWSDENHRIFGIPKGIPLTYETFLSTVHPDDRNYVDQKWQAGLRGEQYDIEHRIVVDGKIKWVRERAELEFDEEGRLLGGFGTTQDITERKAAEFEREATVEFLSLVNRSTSTRSLIEAAADFFQRQCGCEAMGVRLIEGEDYPYYEVRGFPREFVLAENSLCARSDTGEIIRDEKGNPVLECLCGNMICGRFDPCKPFFTPGGSFWTNSTTELLANFTEADFLTRTRNRCPREGYESMALIPLYLGAERLGLLQLNDSRKGLFWPELIALWEKLAGYFAIALAKFRAEEMLRRAYDELEMRVEERTAELSKVNKLLRAEIEERKRIEETQKIYMRRLEQSNRELDDFAFVASHDLQEPLRKIQTFADRLKSMHYHSLDDKGRDYLKRMGQAAGRMQDLIQDLLKYSRITTKPEPFLPINLRKSVKEAVADLRVLCEETGGLVEVGELPTVEADQVQMRQLFQNLIGNGLKYHGEQKPVVKVYGGLSDVDGYCNIYVEDNGIGFNESSLERIFKPFQRLHGKHAEYHGTGMGLAICRKIVERHGGSITARSEPGKGAKFIVRLPEKQQNWEGTYGPIVVMVDDDDDDCMLARDAFQESKARGAIHCIEDGVELMDYLFRSGKYSGESEPPLPALILLDLNMPRKDGREVLKEIKSIPVFQNIPIVVLTTSQEEKDIAFSREAGANAFISKPSSFSGWVKIMRSLAQDWLHGND
jgi:PAS domain S-box-containing protein